MILVHGGRGATGADLEQRPAGARARRVLADRRHIAARRRRRRESREAHGMPFLPPLEELTAGLAHDLNNRLAVILGQTQLLARGLSGEPAGSRRLQKIEEETLRASRMTRGLLDMTRRQEPRHAPVSINKLVPQALAMTHAKRRRRAIALRTELCPGAPLVRGDAEQLTQVLVHLIDNAIDAMGDTGTLTITTAVSDDALELAVTDTGVGMDQDETTRIFEPFYTTKPGGEHGGLGLFHTLTVLKAHGASVAVDSAPGCGTRMCVRMPRPLSLATTREVAG